MSSEVVVVGTRGSTLALAQTEWVVRALQAMHPQVSFQVRRIKTRGDRVLNRALHEVGGKGVFVKEIEEALLDGAVDLAVHSLKDLPSEQPPGLTIGVVPERADPRDVLITRDGRGLADLPPGARVGTSSLRRTIQLQALRPDLQVVNIRGNVDTRLRKLDQGQYDAIILAAAGLARLGLLDRVVEFFDPQEFLPAPGQGALAVEVRADDAETQALIAPLEHPPTRLAVEAERAFLRQLGGGCQVPMAAYARLDGEELVLRAMLADEDGANVMRDEIRGPASQAVALGRRLAERIVERIHEGR